MGGSDGIASLGAALGLAALQHLGAALTGSDSDDEAAVWKGDIQKGDHVRCVKQTYGAGQVRIGDVGVVRSRNGSTYSVDFPEQGGWTAAKDDIVVDVMAQRVRTGARVRVKPTVTKPAYEWGPVKSSHVGLVREVTHDGDVKIEYGMMESYVWKGVLAELTVVSGSIGGWQGSLQCGQAVRVPDHVKVPSLKWGDAKPGSIGYVRAFEGGVYRVDFPEVDGWKGRAEDLEVDAVADAIRPGRRVRVRASVTEPQDGWGPVEPGHVGTVRSCRYDGSQVVVSFPTMQSWKGQLKELEAVDGPASDEVNCIGRHGLEEQDGRHVEGEKWCDWCGAAPPAESVLYGCRACNADICKACVDQAKAKGKTVATRSRTAAGPASHRPGACVVLCCLTSSAGAQLNGRVAEVLSFDPTSARYTVRILGSWQGDAVVSVREQCVEKPVQRHCNGTVVKLRALEEEPRANGKSARVVGFNAETGCYRLQVIGSLQIVSAFPHQVQADTVREVD